MRASVPSSRFGRCAMFPTIPGRKRYIISRAHDRRADPSRRQLRRCAGRGTHAGLIQHTRAERRCSSSCRRQERRKSADARSSAIVPARTVSQCATGTLIAGEPATNRRSGRHHRAVRNTMGRSRRHGRHPVRPASIQASAWSSLASGPLSYTSPYSTMISGAKNTGGIGAYHDAHAHHHC